MAISRSVAYKMQRTIKIARYKSLEAITQLNGIRRSKTTVVFVFLGFLRIILKWILI